MRILYVEDNLRDADVTVRVLRKTAPHLQLETVSTINESIERLGRISSDPLDLVLVDVHLRDGDGLSLLRYIRENSLPLAVVLITGMGDEETAVAALKARADDYIVKRKDYLDRLPVTLESALNHYRADAARRARPLNVLYAADKSTDIESTRRHFAVHAEHLRLSFVSTASGTLWALQPHEGKPPYDVLLIEFHLPELNALELLREVRLTLKQDLPVVLVFNEGDEELAHQSLKLGASSYLVKSPGYLYQLTWQLEDAHSRADMQRREAALQASEARNQAILNAIPDLMFLQSRDGTFLDYHATDTRLLLMPPEQFLGKKMQDVLPPQLAADLLHCFEQALVSDEPVRHEYALSMPEGIRFYEASLVSCNGDKLLSIVRDITERKLAENESLLLAAIVASSNDAIISKTLDGRVTSWNRAAERMYGYTAAEALGRNISFIYPEESSHELAMIRESLGRGERIENLETVRIRKDGARVDVSLSISPIRDIQGRLIGASGIGRDITERKLAEEALRESEERLRLAQQAARVGTWEWDMRTGVSVWSDMIWELLGLERDDDVTTVERFIEFIHPEDRDRVLNTVNEVIAEGEDYYNEFRIVRRDGVVLWVTSKGRLIRSADGQPDRMIGVNMDITERKLAEVALRESEGRLRLAQQAARIGTWEWDVPMGQALWSEMMWELLGLEPDNGSIMTLDRFIEFIHPEDRDRALRKVNDVIAEGEEYYDEFRLVRCDGRVLWISSKGRLARSASGRPERMLGVNIDITERKEAEESLRKALAEVQELKDRLHEQNIYLQEEIRVASNFGEIIGHSRAMRRVLRQAEQVAPVETSVLILGETGTGKELLANAIHNLSPRHKHPLVKVNCAALPAPLIESELFGHEKGAFTGADARRRGRFELADGGTILLDEVGELPLDLQSKLLRVLEAGEFEHVGSSRTIRVDVRVIAATNRNLAEAVGAGTFRSDLYYRLSIFPITLPPLRERQEDIPMLVTHLVKELSLKLGKEIKTVSQRDMALLQNNPWPGNVRELRNVIERAVIVTQGPVLQLIDSLKSLSLDATSQGHDKQSDSPVAGAGGDETLRQSEYNLILRTLTKVHWKVEGPGGAAELLKISPGTLRSRMKKLGITRPNVHAASSQGSGP